VQSAVSWTVVPAGRGKPELESGTAVMVQPPGLGAAGSLAKTVVLSDCPSPAALCGVTVTV
jgi:hypothetical protein